MPHGSYTSLHRDIEFKVPTKSMLDTTPERLTHRFQVVVGAGVHEQQWDVYQG